MSKYANSPSDCSPQAIRVLLTSASRKIPLVRALQKAARTIHPKACVIAGDIDPSSLSFYVADATWTMPRLIASDARFVLDQCLELGINVVLPTRDSELMFWAQNASTFRQAGIEVVVSNPESLKRCLDKISFSEFGIAHGLPMIPSSLSTDGLLADHFVVKERFGSGSRSAGINLTHAKAISHAVSLNEPIFQPYIAGQEISIDAWLDQKSRVKGLVLRRRDLVHNGESQVTTTFRDESIESLAAEILTHLMLNGPVVMQSIVDPTGNLNIIECNARFGGASTASIAVGLDSLRWSLIEAVGDRHENYPFVRALSDVKQIRIPVDMHEQHSDL